MYCIFTYCASLWGMGQMKICLSGLWWFETQTKYRKIFSVASVSEALRRCSKSLYRICLYKVQKRLFTWHTCAHVNRTTIDKVGGPLKSIPPLVRFIGGRELLNGPPTLQIVGWPMRTWHLSGESLHAGRQSCSRRELRYGARYRNLLHPCQQQLPVWNKPVHRQLPSGCQNHWCAAIRCSHSRRGHTIQRFWNQSYCMCKKQLFVTTNWSHFLLSFFTGILDTLRLFCLLFLDFQSLFSLTFISVLCFYFIAVFYTISLRYSLYDILKIHIISFIRRSDMITHDDFLKVFLCKTVWATKLYAIFTSSEQTSLFAKKGNN